MHLFSAMQGCHDDAKLGEMHVYTLFCPQLIFYIYIAIFHIDPFYQLSQETVLGAQKFCSRQCFILLVHQRVIDSFSSVLALRLIFLRVFEDILLKTLIIFSVFGVYLISVTMTSWYPGLSAKLKLLQLKEKRSSNVRNVAWVS